MILKKKKKKKNWWTDAKLSAIWAYLCRYRCKMYAGEAKKVNVSLKT